MNFKEQTQIFLEAYSNEIIEESVRNSSASSRLLSLIKKAEGTPESQNTIATLKKAYNAFLKVENAYKNASAEEKKKLKNEYNDLKKKYAYQLKRIHAPRGAAAILIAAAINAISSAPSYSLDKPQLYQGQKQSIEYSEPKVTKVNDAEARWNKKVAEMEEKNKAFRAESSDVNKVMDKAVMDLMVAPSTNTYNSVKMNNNGHVSNLNKDAFKKFAKVLFSTYGVKVNTGDDVMPAIKFYLDEFNGGKPHNLYNKEQTRKNLQERIISKEEQQRNSERRATAEKLKAHPTKAMEYFNY